MKVLRTDYPRGIALGVTSALALAACTPASDLERLSSPSAGFESVATTARTATGAETVWLQSAEDISANAKKVSALVSGKTISADTAVQVALLNNRGLQAAYADLGLSAADAWQVALAPNPSLHLGVLGLGTQSLDGFRTLEGGIAANLLALTTQKSRNRIADVRFRKAQLVAAEETLRVATEARKAWITTVAAFETASLVRQTQETADAASELAAELGKTGYLGRDDQAREHAFAAELAGQRAQADLAAKLAKEDLTRIMGLFGADLNYFVPNALPGLPRIADRKAFESEALAGRVDLAAAKLELEAVALDYRLGDRTRVVSDIALAAGTEIERELEDGARHSARTDSLDLEVAFEIPIFDSGAARLRKGEVAYMKAAHQLAQKAVDVRSEARAAHLAWTGTHKIARHYRDVVLPLRKTIEEEALLSYNGMITNTFELLADTRARMQSNLLEASARRDFWLADANMTAVLYGGGGATAPSGGGGATAAAEEPAGH